ncbi:MAG: sigma-70 family RNA polymerase sigma factor [Deltaproteobacteria bacterium]|nr:sigma-70 family RNA polymerase sigma factor [Deltaproteobacteria bacterium]
MSQARQPKGLEELLQRGFRFALSLTGDRQEAEDLLQDAWVAMLRSRSPRHLGYLFQVIRNRFLDLQRRRGLVSFEPIEASEDELGGLGFLDATQSRVDLATVEQALRYLRPQEREALFLAAVEGYTVKEIAELTERPLGTVSSLVQRARKKIQSRFRGDHERALP